MQLHTAGSWKSHVGKRGGRARPHPRPNRLAASGSRTRRRPSTAAAGQSSAPWPTRCRSRRTSSAMATRCCAPSCAGASPGERRWREAPLTPVDAHHNGVRWEGAFTVETPGRTQWTIQAWVDLFAGWRDELGAQGRVRPARPQRRAQRGRRAAARRRRPRQGRGRPRALTARRRGDRHRSARGARPALLELVESVQERSEAHRAARRRSRSTSTARWRASAPGTSSSRARGAASRASQEQLPSLAELGFDVLYMPPIHPIGHTNRKGRNNTLDGRARRPRQPVRDRRRDRRPRRDPPRARDRRGLPRARRTAATSTASTSRLDLAINCSPDHPWLKEHPEWFFRRPDGTLKYAENPPKKYQDIYNVNFGSEDWRGLWDALLAVDAPLGRSRREGLPRRQPAHQALRLLGVAHHGDPRHATPR